MKLIKKMTLSVLIFAGALSLTFASSLGDISKLATDTTLAATINSNMDDFASELGFSVPQAAVQQNVYAESFIGDLFPGIPPHFAVGFNAGVTHLNTEGLANAASALGIDGVNSSYYFPVLNADLRLGGVILPFDVGFSFMKLDVSSLTSMSADFTADFFTFALDARYAILKDGIVTPAVSVGVGYSINKGSFGAGSDYADVNVDYDVQTLYLQAQISKTLNIPVARIGFTPFLGLRGVLSSYSNDWSWKVKGEALDEISSITGVKTSGSGTASGAFGDLGDLQPQIYGGIGFNFVFLQLTASACADLRHLGGDSSLWSGALSLRFKM